LKKSGFKKAGRYKDKYQLDMILHTYQVHGTSYFSLIDLYRKRVKQIPIELRGPIELRFKGISNKLLVKQDLDRVLRAKREALRIKEVAISPEAMKINLKGRHIILPGKETISSHVSRALRFSGYFCSSSDLSSSLVGGVSSCARTFCPIPQNIMQKQIIQTMLILMHVNLIISPLCNSCNTHTANI